MAKLKFILNLMAGMGKMVSPGQVPPESMSIVTIEILAIK